MRFNWLCITTFLLLNAGPVNAADQPVKEVRELAAQWRRSFVNLHVKYALWSLPEDQAPLDTWSSPPDLPASSKFSEVEWMWADHGLDLWDTRSFFWGPGTPVRSTDGFNGPRKLSFRATYRQMPESTDSNPRMHMQSLQLQAVNDSRPTSFAYRIPFEGLYWPSTGQWLHKYLGVHSWTNEGERTVQTHNCLKLKAVDGMRVHFLWLDTTTGLCCRYRVEFEKDDGTIVGTDFIVDEFETAESGITYPRAGRVQLLTSPVQNQMFRVTKAAFNTELDAARFNPPKPMEGTVVVDRRSPGSPKIHGKPLNHGPSTDLVPASGGATTVDAD